MADIYFKEKQKLKMGWKWIVFIVIYGLLFWSLIQQFSEETDIKAVITIVLSIVVIVFFNLVIAIMHLEIKIKADKIFYQYKPFHRAPKLINLQDIEKLYIRDYKPFMEYGGYGIQKRARYGKAFTVAGKKGLQLIFKDGRKILIGTQKPKELKKVVEKLKSSTH